MNGEQSAPLGGQPGIDAILDGQAALWNRGEGPWVEDLLTLYPMLRTDAEAAVDVIYQEFVLRRARGESPRPEVYLRRFPAWADALMRQFAVDEALRPLDGVTTHEPGEPSTAIGPSPAAGATEPAPPSRSIDGYEIFEELGRGAMGVVFKALDPRLKRVVAIKTVSDAIVTAPAQLRRFIAEAEVIARLRHPNIIPIYAVGEQNGRPYFSLELAEGGNLSQRLAKGPLTGREAALLVEELSRAVSTAHTAGIIHRDLKPSNVLLALDGTPKIGDFGLAKLVGDDTARTLSGEVLGTPSYMAPEQAEGRSREVGPAADIYALGAILYHALTGRAPFLGASAIGTMKLVASTEAVPPRRLRPDVPRELETIALKCLEKDPRARYTDAGALGDDLRRFLEGRPIAARPVGPSGRFWRWCRRNPMLAATAAASLMTFLLGTPALLGLWLQARADRARAEIERDRAEQSRDRALHAVRKLLESGSDESRGQEPRPDRESLSSASFDEAQALVGELEGDPASELQRIDAYIVLARAQRDSGQAATAFTSARTAVSLAEELVAREPSNKKYRGRLARALHKLSSLGMTDECLMAARQSNELCRQLAIDGPEDERIALLGMIATNSYNIGFYSCGKGQFTAAIESFLEVESIYQKVSAVGWRAADVRYLAAMNQLHLCRIYARENQPDRALAAGREAVAISQSLVADYPERFEFGERLHMAQEELATRYLAAQKTAEAIKTFESARETLKQMAANHRHVLRTMACIQSLLAQTDQHLCVVYDSDPVRYAEPRRSVATEAFEIADKLSLFQPLVGNLRIVYASRCLDRIEYQEDDGEIPDLKPLVKGERLCDAVSHETPTDRQARIALVMIRRKLADLLAARGEDQQASEWRRRSLAPARGDANLFYEIAAAYGRQTGLVGRLPTKLTALQLDARRAQFTKNALSMLHEAAAEGFADGVKVRKDTAFGAISSNPQFQAIVTHLE